MRCFASVAASVMLAFVAVAPAPTQALQAPPIVALQTESALPKLSLSDVPEGFTAAPSFMNRYIAMPCMGDCSGATFTRGEEYIASAVRPGLANGDVYDVFARTVMPMEQYRPRWLDPPAVGDEAALFALTDWGSSGALKGHEVRWHRGGSLGRVTVIGVSDGPSFAIALAKKLDDELIAGGASEPTPRPDGQVEQIAQQVWSVRGLARRGRASFEQASPVVYDVLSWRLRQTAWPPDLTRGKLLEVDDATRMSVAASSIDPQLDLGILRLLGQDIDIVRLTAPGPTLLGVYNTQNRVGLVAASWPLGWREQIVLAHELAHSVQDQHFGLDELTSGLLTGTVGRNTDAELAMSALINGEAEHTTRLWADEYVRPGSWGALQEEADEYDRAASIPPLWRVEGRFPYRQGERMAAQIFAAGGWGAVNALFANPPVSTEQVLHPHLTGPQASPRLVSTPPTSSVAVRGWRPLVDDTLGEARIRGILEPFLGDSRAESAAAGWGGDRYVVVGVSVGGPSPYRVSGHPFAFSLDSVWDSPAEADEFFAALADSLDLRFAGQASRQAAGAGRATWVTVSHAAVLDVRGDRVRFVVGSDLAAVDALAPILGARSPVGDGAPAWGGAEYGPLGSLLPAP